MVSEPSRGHCPRTPRLYPEATLHRADRLTADRHPPGARSARTGRRGGSQAAGGYSTTSLGVVSGLVGGPKSLTTWSIVPWLVMESVRMSCSFTPGRTGTSNAWLEWMVGSTLKKQ